MEINGKTALVTGGASGIGLACVRELLRHGAQVSVCDVNEVTGAAVTKELMNEFGPNKAVFIRVDVTNSKEFEDAFKLTILNFKSLDIVLNNAGICDHKNWERMIAVNLNSVVIGTELAFKYMGRNYAGGGGILCNTASVAGYKPVASMPVYAATKFAVVGLTRSYGLPHHADMTGVRVVAMCPGVTETSLFNDVTTGGDDVATHVTEELASVSSQTAEHVASGMLTMIRVAESGTIWVCNGGAPAYEVKFPPVEPVRQQH